MKSLKAIAPAAVLALALSASAFAGDIQTPGAPLPPPPPPANSANNGNGCVSAAVCSNSGNFYASACAEILLALTSLF